MVGQTLESRPRGFAAPGVVVALLAAVVLAGAGAALGTPHLAFLAVFPATLAVFWGLFAERPFRATLTETGIEITRPPRVIPYDEIQGLQARRPANPYRAGRPTYPIRVIHTEGAVVIPARLDIRSDEVYSFLFHRLSSGGSSEVNPALADYLHEKRRDDGPGRVWSYRARRYQGGNLPSRPGMLFVLALMLSGSVWLPLGLLRDEPPWVIAGFWSVILGGMSALGLWLHSRGRLRPAQRKRFGSLVICPDGLALVQKDLVGQLRWDEIRSLHLRGGRIQLKIAGAEIVLGDVYDRPISLIHQLLTHYYEGGAEASGQPAWQFDATRLRDEQRPHSVARRDDYRD
jgi:hypothetical protein